LNDELIATAEIGEKAKEFLESDLGKVMLGLAQQETQIAMELLGEIDPTNEKKIRDLQNQIKVGKWFTQWLTELVTDGEQAINVFKQQMET
jgi:flagellar biosynthesis chaperone FliJ